MLMMDETPLYLNIFNLRRTLDMIARNEDRFDDFIQRNPIPGLAVVQDRVTNAETIMPRAYGPAVIYRDASAVRSLMNYTAAKMRDVNLYTGRLGQIGEGSAAILLKSTSFANDQEVRIPTSPLGDLRPVQGTVDNYWSDHKLSDESIRLGVLGLYVREDTSDAYLLWLDGH